MRREIVTMVTKKRGALYMGIGRFCYRDNDDIVRPSKFCACVYLRPDGLWYPCFESTVVGMNDKEAIDWLRVSSYRIRS